MNGAISPDMPTSRCSTANSTSLSSQGRSRAGPNVLVRVHSECLTGDVFGSLRCDCGPQLHAAFGLIAQEGSGVVVYLRGHEGRGIGLAHKLRAYSLQEQGHDTVDANLELGLPVDSREYGIGAQILMDLGVTTMRVMTNNPMKYTGLDGYGLDIVGRVPLNIEPNIENRAYLVTKRDKLGHLLTGLDVHRAPDSNGSDPPWFRTALQTVSPNVQPSQARSSNPIDFSTTRPGSRRRISKGCRARGAPDCRRRITGFNA